MAFGGSTNAVLHLLAIAREAGVDLELEDFNRIADKVPHLGDLKPSGNMSWPMWTRSAECPWSCVPCWTRGCSTATP